MIPRESDRVLSQIAATLQNIHDTQREQTAPVALEAKVDDIIRILVAIYMKDGTKEDTERLAALQVDVEVVAAAEKLLIADARRNLAGG